MTDVTKDKRKYIYIYTCGLKPDFLKVKWGIISIGTTGVNRECSGAYGVYGYPI